MLLCMNTTLQIRIDKKTKGRATKAFQNAGICLSSGLRLLLTHIGRTGKVPQNIFTFANLPDSEMKKIMREADYALKHGKRYDSAKEMLNDILGK